MKQFIILTALLLLPSLTISAMEDFSAADSIRNEQDRKRINDIKLKENALYAEIREAIYIGDEGEDEDMAKVKALTKAQQKSIDLLQTHVIEIFARRLKMSKQDVQEIWDVIDDKCQNIEVKRGDLFRVFSYIMKDALRIGLKGKLSPEEIEEVLGKDPNNTSIPPTTPANPEPEEHLTEDTTTTTVPPVVPTYPLTLEATAGGHVNEGGEYQAGTSVTIEAVPNEGFKFAGWTTQEGDTLSKELSFNYTMQAKAATLTAHFTEIPVVKPEEPKESPSTEPKVEPQEDIQVEPKTEPEVEPEHIEVPQLCRTLLEKDNMTDLLTFLDGEKTFQKLIYGSQKNMKSPEKCYIVILNKDTRKIVTVLGQGQTERMNYFTKKPDNYNNYRGSGEYMAVFVQEL